MVRPLALGLLDEETAVNVARDLNDSAVKRNYKVGTGFLSTPFVLSVLTKYGYSDTAYRMLENTEAPGWLAMVEAGATSVWETYIMYDADGHPISHSMNHYSPGAVCSYLFNTVCGINIEGDRSFMIKPVISDTLEFAEASYNSPYGLIKASWKRNNGQVSYRINIPANCHAHIILNDEVHEVGNGQWEYTL